MKSTERYKLPSQLMGWIWSWYSVIVSTWVAWKIGWRKGHCVWNEYFLWSHTSFTLWHQMTQFISSITLFTGLTCSLICQILSEVLQVRVCQHDKQSFYFYCSVFLHSGILTTEKTPVISYVIMGNLRGEETDLLSQRQ